MLIDSHCHLTFDKLAEDEDGVLARARAAGVGRFLTIGTSRSEFDAILAFAQRHADVYCALGVHPHEAEKPGEAIDSAALVALAAAQPKLVGIGEAGLDYFYDFAPREAQQRTFREHIRAAMDADLPLVIHTREADQDTIRILQEETQGREGRLRGVLHCYSSGRELALYGLSIGFYVSFSGMITFKKAENVRQVAALVPLERLLIETDSPYLAPLPHRGKTCEPAFVADTARFIAELRGLDFEALAQATSRNFFDLFTKVPRP